MKFKKFMALALCAILIVSIGLLASCDSSLSGQEQSEPVTEPDTSATEPTTETTTGTTALLTTDPETTTTTLPTTEPITTTTTKPTTTETTLANVDLKSGSKSDVIDQMIATNKTNVRCGDGTNYAVVGSIAKGQKVDVVKKNSSWVTILFNGNKLAYVAASNLAAITTTTTKAPTTTKASTTESTDSSSKNPYYIYCELGSFTVTIYGLDDNEEYTKVVKQFSAAIGRTTGQTPTGKFKIQGKERWHAWGANSYSQYSSKYTSGLYFHSPLYSSKNNSTLMVSSYNAIGTKCTSGCFRITTANAKWIYDNCKTGTVVEIVNGSPRGTSSSRPAQISSGTKKDPTDKW